MPGRSALVAMVVMSWMFGSPVYAQAPEPLPEVMLPPDDPPPPPPRVYKPTPAPPPPTQPPPPPPRAAPAPVNPAPALQPAPHQQPPAAQPARPAPAEKSVQQAPCKCPECKCPECKCEEKECPSSSGRSGPPGLNVDPPPVVIGQALSFVAAEWAGFLMIYGVAWLCPPFSWPVAPLLGCVGVPGFAGTVATVMGDYLSGHRHPLAVGLLASYGSIWLVATITLVANVVLGALMYFVGAAFLREFGTLVADGYNAHGLTEPTGAEQEKARTLVQQKGISTLMILGGMAATVVGAAVGFTLGPPTLTSIALSLLVRQGDWSKPVIVENELGPEHNKVDKDMLAATDDDLTVID